jgi:cobalt-zinc-cadmium efflux system outer membrane protein
MRAFAAALFWVWTAQCVAAQTVSPPSQVATTAPPITLPDLERIALESNPTVRAAQAQIDAAKGRARQAGAWPNPIAGFTAEEIKLGEEDKRGEYGFFVDQTVVMGGKLRLSRAVFERAAEGAEASLELQRLRIVSSVRRAFYEALTTDRRVEVHERLAALVSEAVGITAQLFNVGAADRPDFLESEIEARRVQLELNAAKNRAFAVRQELAALVGQVEIANRPLAGSLDQPLPEIEREAALRGIVDQSPQVRAARAELARVQAATALARRETFPDLFLRAGAAYNRERGEDTRRPIGWEGALEAGISLPLFNRNAGGIAAARADEMRAEADLQRVQLLLRSRLASEFAAYLTAVRNAEIYRTEILPRAEEAYRLYLTRYREMGAAYPQVLIAQRNLFELSSDYLESLEDAWRSALRIQGLLAGDGLQSPGGEAEDLEVLSTGRERGGR